MSFFKSLKGFLTYLKISKNNDKKKSVYIYSEGLNYRNYFIEVINCLNKKNIQVFYFTSDKKDLDSINENIKPIFIGKGLIRILFFTSLSCDFMLMTLTDLNNHELKRSLHCKKYAYIFHSLVSTHKTYNKNAFNNYDIIFSNGEYQKNELLKLEEINISKKKKIYNTGYSYLEFLQKQKINQKEIANNVLFAPSWSKFNENLFEKHGYDLIKSIIRKRKIILRPHPQSLIKSSKQIKLIEKKFLNNKNFLLNKNIFDLKPIFQSQILITDNGGMALEYAFITKKPVIFIDFKDKVHNKDFKKINLETLEDNFRKKFGLVVQANQIENLNDIIDHKVKDYENFGKDIENFFKENKIEFRNSSNKIADIIEKELNFK